MPSQQTEYPLDFKNILLHTGNISKERFNIEYELFNEKSNKELLKALDNSFSTLFEERTSLYDQTTGLWKITNQQVINQQVTDQLEVTVKLFLLNTAKMEQALESLEHIQTQLNIKHIDTLIVSEREAMPTAKNWEQLESWVQSGKIRRLGVTDVDYQTLTSLIKNKNTLPHVNQVHVQDLNKHKDLIQFAKVNDIELLYNGDRTDVLTEKELSLLMHRYNLLENNAKATPHWVLKYNVFVPFRQVVLDKGYIIMASRTEDEK